METKAKLSHEHSSKNRRMHNFDLFPQKIPNKYRQRFMRALQICSFIIIFYAKSLQAQDTSLTTGRSAVTGGYFGEVITHTGLFAGYEHNLMPRKHYQILPSMTLGGYVHRRNHTALFAELGIAQRLIFRKRFFLEQSFGIGYLHTFLNGGPVYEVKEDGTVSKSSNLGRPHVMPSVSIGFGWNIAASKKLPLLVFLRPKAFWQYPFNGYALPHLAIQAGITKVIR